MAENINTDASKLYPFCLAYPLENELEKLGEAKDWQIEYKWDWNSWTNHQKK